jgi:uncharacterized protein (UPF0332 family)
MTREQAELVGKATDSLEAARLLHEHGKYGFAAARAYYAMFYLAEALLLGEGLAFSRHSGVAAAFGERFAKGGRLPEELHRYLIRGLEIRQLADYSTSPVSESEAAEQIGRAERFVRLATELLSAGSAGENEG